MLGRLWRVTRKLADEGNEAWERVWLLNHPWEEDFSVGLAIVRAGGCTVKSPRRATAGATASAGAAGASA